MAEHLHHHPWGHALRQEQGRAAMAEVVEPSLLETDPL